MKKLFSIVTLSALIAITCTFAAPVHAEEVEAPSYTAIVPSIAAIAEWAATYFDTYQKDGIYQAVAEIFEAGEASLDEITEISLTSKEMEGLNPIHLVAAYYCAGAKHEDIRATTEKHGLSEMTLVNGFETAKTVCGDEILDTQAYTPLVQFSGPPAGATPRGSSASASDFTNL